MNHENKANVFSDNTKGLLGSEYPISKNQFNQIFRYPDL